MKTTLKTGNFDKLPGNGLAGQFPANMTREAAAIRKEVDRRPTITIEDLMACLEGLDQAAEQMRELVEKYKGVKRLPRNENFARLIQSILDAGKNPELQRKLEGIMNSEMIVRGLRKTELDF